MVGPHQWVQHIESYVNSSGSPTEQASSLNAIVSLVKNNLLTIEVLVREMEMYLTTTDYIIRGKGILLLAEVLVHLASKRLDSTTLHSLIEFFTERLADWKALRGALVGCLALMRRNSSVGMVTVSDARAVARSYLQNLQVQMLGQHDRKLCFELLECLLVDYPAAVAVLDDDLVYGTCEAFDGEKDPQCLLLTFHIVEILAQLFPDPSGPMARFAGEFFEILERYFPIHFTHPSSEDVDVKRDDLSKALMLAFSSTPYFEPFVIPLLLDKLSSLLPVAKADSLKYLSTCTLKYGAERMAKHANAIWSSIKEVLNDSIQDADLVNHFGSHGDIDYRGNEISTEVLKLLKNVVMQNSSLFLNLITSDEDVNMSINTLASFRSFNEILMRSKQRLYATGCILSVSAKASIACCSGLFEHFFSRLIDILGFELKGSSEDGSSENNCLKFKQHNVGVLYLSLELLSACRDLILNYEYLAPKPLSGKEVMCAMLHRFSGPLADAFGSALVSSANDLLHDFDVYVGVRGLQTLATYPGGFLPISRELYEIILLKLMSIITMGFRKTLQWNLALNALVQIGSFLDKHNESEKAQSFMSIVVEKFVSLISLDDLSLPFSLKLEALFDVGGSGQTFLLKAVEGLEEAISANLYEVHVRGNSIRVDIAIQLLECYSNKVLPRFQKMGGSEELPLHFSSNIWDHIKNGTFSSGDVHDKELLDATMTAMKVAVGSCSEKTQSIIIEKAYGVLSSSSLLYKELMTASTHLQQGGLLSPQFLDSFACRDEWFISIFASVIIAARPLTEIKNLREILKLFASAFLMGLVPAAQALGSLLNKMPLKINGVEIYNALSLQEAIDIIFERSLWNYGDAASLRRSLVTDEDCETSVANLDHSTVHMLQSRAIDGLAWMGKGLLMRGHENVKDITMILLKILLSNDDENALPLRLCLPSNSNEQNLVSSVRKSAADAFHILMSDSEICLHKKFHAIIRPLYKQRFFSTMMPVMLSSITKSDSSTTRLALYRACGHIISDTPLTAVLSEANKIVTVLVDCLRMLSEDIFDKDLIYNLMLVFSGILTDRNGQEVVSENAHSIINCLSGLVSYPHMMLVRETAIQCLIALSDLPYARIYPMRTLVLRNISKAFDDRKRAVRQEAVRCQQAWKSIASQGLHS